MRKRELCFPRPMPSCGLHYAACPKQGPRNQQTFPFIKRQGCQTQQLLTFTWRLYIYNLIFSLFFSSFMSPDLREVFKRAVLASTAPLPDCHWLGRGRVGWGPCQTHHLPSMCHCRGFLAPSPISASLHSINNIIWIKHFYTYISMFASFFFSKPPLKYRTESRWLERSVEGKRSKESRTSVLQGGWGKQQQQESSILAKVKPSDMLFKPILASIWKSCQGTLGEGCNSLFLSLVPFIPPSPISLSSDLASGFCPYICYLIPL